MSNIGSSWSGSLDPSRPMQSSDFIWTKKKSLSKSYCEKLIEKYEKHKEQQHEGLVGVGVVNKSIKDTSDISMGNNPKVWKKEDKKFCSLIFDEMHEYFRYLQDVHVSFVAPSGNHLDFYDTGYMIQKYEPGGFYEWNQDWTILGTGSRVYTFIWYLNTIKKSDGGWTEFIDGTKIQPKAGKLVMFPATWTYLHRAYPPKVPKYIVTGWIYAKSKDEKAIEDLRDVSQREIDNV